MIPVLLIYGFHRSNVVLLVVNNLRKKIDLFEGFESIVVEQKTKYNSHNSNTSRANGASFRIAYGDGSYVIGTFVNDTVAVGENAG